MISFRFQGKPFNITVIQVCAPTTNDREDEVELFYEYLQDFLEKAPNKDVLFITGDSGAIVGTQETTGVTVKFGLGGRNEAGQRLTEFCQENSQVVANTLPQTTKDGSTHGHHKMVHTEIRMIIFFAAVYGEALYSWQKEDWELTAAQIMSSLL